jgi:hypothetical protein
MEYLEEQLDITTAKIAKLESDIHRLEENMTIIIEQMNDFKRYLVKMAHNQAEVAKRISAWPYIAVPEKKGE